MRAEQVLQHLTTPLTGPAYPITTGRFTDREYFNVVYRTDPDTFAALVPEPLEVDEPLVRFEIMKMGDVEGLGPYTEGGIALKVRHGDEHGEYLHAMYLDNFAGTAGGRELSAYPKVIGSPRLYADGSALVGTLDLGTLRVATATMGYKQLPMDPEKAKAEITVPTYMVKLVPGYGMEHRVADLVRTQITDVTVKGAWHAPARLQLFEHALAPIADLPVLEIVSASHIVTDLSLNRAKPIYDYLAGAPVTA